MTVLGFYTDFTFEKRNLYGTCFRVSCGKYITLSLGL